MLARFWTNEDGATAIEYGLIAALIAVTLIVSFVLFGSELAGLYSYIDSRAGGAMNAATA